MRKSLPALAAVPFLLAVLAGPARAEGPTVGLAYGGGLVGPPTGANGALNTNVQGLSGIFIRAQPAGPWTEASIGLLSRGQALGMNRDKVYETSGLALSIGAKAGFFHASIDGELSLLHEIVQDPSAAGSLMFHNGAGVVIEPHVSEPIANGTAPAPTAEPEPLDDPPLHASAFHGFSPGPVMLAFGWL